MISKKQTAEFKRDACLTQHSFPVDNFPLAVCYGNRRAENEVGATNAASPLDANAFHSLGIRFNHLEVRQNR